MGRSRQKLSSSSSSKSITNDICNDIITQILSWLPVDSLFRFKSVCKSWFTLITDPRFAKLQLLHHHHYSLTTTTPQIHNPTIMFTSPTNYSLKSMDKLVSSSSSSLTVLEKLEMVYPFDSTRYWFRIVGSCNGLICISAYDKVDRKEILCLWNPSTKEFKQLPSHEEDDAPFEFPPDENENENEDEDDDYYGGNGRRVSKIATFGFGYDHVMEDYKVIASVQWFSRMGDYEEMDHDMYHYELKVYTLGTDSWRRIQGTPYENEHYDITTWLHVSGIFHRIAHLSSSDKDNRILSFDIVEEVYGEVPKPDCFYGRYGWTLAELRGCLCLCDYKRLSTKHESITEVWMMMKYGVEESWTKLFNIASGGVHSYLFKPMMWFCRNGKLLMEDESNSKLVIYDPKHNEAKLLRSLSRADIPVETIIYIASLVSLKSQKEIEKELIC